MSPKRARDLAKGLIVDLDGAIAGDPRDPAARHSAAASGAILATRLLGGLCVNIARIATAAERIADVMEDESEKPAGPVGAEDRAPDTDGG